MDRRHCCPFPEYTRVFCRSIRRKVKDFFSFFTCSMSVREQSRLLDPGMPVCPTCGHTLKKNGYKTSKFHAIFSDHTVRIQKHHCSHPDCGWHSTPTITALFGTNIHPDLATLQCAQGALYSFREAEKNLEQWNSHPRRVDYNYHGKRFTGYASRINSFWC